MPDCTHFTWKEDTFPGGAGLSTGEQQPGSKLGLGRLQRFNCFLRLLLRAFFRFLPESWLVQKALQAWTFVDFGQASSGQDGHAGGGRAMRRTAPASRLAQFGREVFCLWRPLEAL